MIKPMVRPEELGTTDPQFPMRSGVAALVSPMIRVTTTATTASTPSTIQARGRRTCLISSTVIIRECPCVGTTTGPVP